MTDVNEELLNSLWAAQLKHTRGLIDDAIEHGGTGDDGHDYLDAALELSNTMEMLRFDGILTGRGSLDALLNTPDPLADSMNSEHYQKWEDFQHENGFPALSALACDGVAVEFYQLNCPALPKEES
jgi:hypothetical protein